jgi:hypothetical protein
MPATGRILEFDGDFTIDSDSGGVAESMTVSIRTHPDATIVVDVDRLPRRGTTGGLTRTLWRTRRALGKLLVRSTQALQLNVAGKRLLRIDPTPSRFGSLIGMPGLKFRFAVGSWLADRFSRR